MAQHEEFRQRVEELVALEEHRRTPQVPLDFAELLPAHASEAAIVERGPDEDHVARGATLSELPGADAAALPPEPGVEGQARSRPRRWRRRPKFPLVRQLDETDCGAACVAMVCRHFGRDVALSHIRMAVGTGADGTSLRGVQRGGEHLGLEVRTIKASKERVHELPLPAILHWGGNHWVVLYGIEGNRFYVADPARRLRRLGRDELMEQWSGYAALPAPTPKLADAPLGQASARWLGEFIRPYRWPLLVGVVLAFVAAGLQLMFPVLTQQVIDHVLLQRDYARLYVLTGAMLGLLVLALVLTMIDRRLLTRIAVEIDVKTLDYITGRLLGLPLSYFETVARATSRAAWMAFARSAS